MRINLRDGGTGDAADIRRIYAPNVVGSTVSFEIEVPSVATIAARVAKADAEHPWLVAECDGRVAGYAYATPWRARPAYSATVETAVYVEARMQGRGVGRRLLTSLLRRLREQGLHMVIAGVALPNAASVGLHESLGFTRVGVFPQVGRKLGQWIDVGFWSLPLEPAVAAGS